MIGREQRKGEEQREHATLRLEQRWYKGHLRILADCRRWGQEIGARLSGNNCPDCIPGFPPADLRTKVNSSWPYTLSCDPIYPSFVALTDSMAGAFGHIRRFPSRFVLPQSIQPPIENYCDFTSASEMGFPVESTTRTIVPHAESSAQATTRKELRTSCLMWFLTSMLMCSRRSLPMPRHTSRSSPGGAILSRPARRRHQPLAVASPGAGACGRKARLTR